MELELVRVEHILSTDRRRCYSSASGGIAVLEAQSGLITLTRSTRVRLLGRARIMSLNRGDVMQIHGPTHAPLVPDVFGAFRFWGDLLVSHGQRRG
jgi:hypothetical protein